MGSRGKGTLGIDSLPTESPRVKSITEYIPQDEQEAMNASGANMVTEFILLSISCSREIQVLLFILFLVSYILTLMGNGAIVCAVKLDHKLHTPMYLLLANFSFLEICYINTTVPNMLRNFLSETKTISFTACFLQFYFFFSLGINETFLLPLMAFDRYLAICRPLHYPTIMNNRLCTVLVVLCWVTAFLCYPVPIYFITQLPFCGPNTIDHFVCDPGPLLALSCVPAPGIELSCSLLSSIIIFITLFFILASYTLVLRAVFRVPSAAGRCKAFSPSCGVSLLCNTHGDVHQPKLWKSSWDTEDCNLDLLLSDPTYKPTHLQSPEQRHEGSLEKN
ncbi:Olfactory receptor 11G2 [Sciurus carolinensis]|uniref:Olfactory receptor 11G2 n=1 Tax=Sciurus carolinensis TaxID=30640 RepID=A0AA41MHG1_SCICA|nr:Olfactory receptor 11G2 [Sciurus carolinensis]